MKASELIGKSAAELDKESLALLREQFNLRLQQSNNQLTKSHRLKEIRKDIARIKTVQTQKAAETLASVGSSVQAAQALGD